MSEYKNELDLRQVPPSQDVCPSLKMLDQPGGFQTMFWRTPESPQISPKVPQRRDGEVENAFEAPTQPAIDSLSFYLLAIIYCASICYLACSKVSLATKNFKTTDLDDPSRIPKEKFLNSLKAGSYFC